MVRIFRINDPYRLILVFLLVLAYKLPIILHSGLITQPEMKFLLVGEKLANGSVLYKDLWENIAPFSAWFYMGLNYLFGKSVIACHIISLLLFVFQAALFNVILVRRKVYNENTYIPAFFYSILGLLIFDVTTLSPELLGLTFILFALDSLFSHLELRRKNDINLINLGLYIGIASMFYLPYIVYIVATSLGLLLFTNTIKRRYLLMLFGSVFVLLVIWVYYFLSGAQGDFFRSLIQPLFVFNYKVYFTTKSILFIVVIPLFYLVISIFVTFQSHGFTNYQVRVQSLFFLFLLFQLFAWFLWSQKSGSSLIVYAPVFSFFYTHFFLILRKRLWRTIHFYLIATSLVIVFLLPFAPIKFVENQIQLDRLLVDTEKAVQPGDQGVLVIGEDLSYYYGNSASTPYLNWAISKDVLQNVNDYQNILRIYESFEQQSPDIIIDDNNVFPEIMKRIPQIRENYQPSAKNRYKRISN